MDERYPPQRRRIHYVHATVEAECAALRARGYRDDQMELKEEDGYMHARPIGKPEGEGKGK